MAQSELKVNQRVEGFVCERIEPIAEIRCTAYIFKHMKTGARLIHLYNDDPNNLFSIAFKTPVSDSTGVPHILEHSVLGGSQKFPLKDPFQELLKGSLQTFLNALTYPDKTVYPVSSQVEVDFYNLVDVYCDAVFHPLLTRNTFAQEGWHFEIENDGDAVGIKGIVYNEMKGVFSDFASHVERKTVSFLFPDTSYFYESGGEVEHIPDLTYEKFLEFHKRFYHPSNSYIVLYGNLESQKTLTFLNKEYLSGFDMLAPNSDIVAQPDWKTPRRAVIDAPSPEKDDGLATVAIAWKFGMSADPLNSLVGRILYRYFMGTESSPLKRALIDCGLGEDLDDICGFGTEFVHGIFSVGLRKTKPEHADAVETLVFETIRNEIAQGFDEEILEGAIRQTEFKLREITDAGRFPFNLLLAERCYRSWVYGGDPIAHLAFEKPISIIREHANAGTMWFCDKAKELILNNAHYLRITVRASSSLGKKLETQSLDQAKKLSANFTDSTKEEIRNQTKLLVAEQKKPSAPEAVATLPRLKKTDLPKINQITPAHITTLSSAKAFLHPLFTSGVVYCDIGFDCRAIPQDLLLYLPLYTEMITKCGAAGLSYEAMSKRISLSTGGIDSSIVCETKASAKNDDLVFYCFIHAKALLSRCDEMCGILANLFKLPDLSNKKQIKDLLFEMRNDINASVIDSGHHFAVIHASSHLIPSRALDESLEGITQLRFLDKLIKSNGTDDIVKALQSLHSLIINKNACVVSITADDPSKVTGQIAGLVESLPSHEYNPINLPFFQHRTFKGIEISSSVNFVAKTWDIGIPTPEQTGHYLLLSRNLSTGYLWDKVRVEGGAYGGMAMAQSGHPVFACASYRDPNLATTLSHFEKGLSIVAGGLDSASIDQSIIGTIGRIDAPRTPHEKGYGETLALLCDRTVQHRQQVRESVLNANSESLAKTAQTILDIKDESITVVGSASSFETAEKDQIFLVREPLLYEDN